MFKKISTTINRLKGSRHRLILVALTSCLCLVFVYTNYMHKKYLQVNSSTYAPLLSLIAKAESKNNYNAHFGNASNSSAKFTSMTIKEVMQWQDDYVKKGNPSSAVGKYQILNTTLSELVKQNGINENDLYDEEMQDALAVKLLERRGSTQYVNKELSRDEFAANIAKEWASLPKVVGNNPDDSYYQSDGLNKSLVKVDDVLEAIKPIGSKPLKPQSTR